MVAIQRKLCKLVKSLSKAGVEVAKRNELLLQSRNVGGWNVPLVGLTCAAGFGKTVNVICKICSEWS